MRSVAPIARVPILALFSGTLLAVTVGGPALARSPIDGTKRDFHGNDPVTYQRAGGGGAAWYATAVDDALEVNFHNSTHNNSGVPSLAHNGSGTALVTYSSASSSPCGTGNTAWLQCAAPNGEFWTIYVRNLSSGGPSGWTWWEEQSSCQGHSTCWYMKRALIHEAGHAMLGFPDMCFGSQPCRSEDDTVMNEIDPAVGHTGSTNFTYRRCDEAGAQLDWDLANKSSHYADCFTSGIANVSSTGLYTTMTVGGTTYLACPGGTAAVTGRLEVTDYSSYQTLGNNGLPARTVWFDRGSTTHYASATVQTGSGDNWTKNLGVGSYAAYFTHATADGLTSSSHVSFTVAQSSFC